ncbi:hypothetical protein T492DRAFT_122706 [Pavlovales sp. CCMP2436]|nr:hypothetical protein T492DRAFT_122706 [Pavlovales sp. CCMP2436]
MELATKEWSTNILPNWTEMRHAEQTRLLWWEGIPSSERGRVWLCVLGETEKGEKGGELSADANLVGGRAKAGSKEEEAVRTAGEWLDEQLPSEHAELSQLYAAANSPFRSDAVSLLASLQLQLQGLSQHGKVHIRECAPTAPLIAGMLLIHLEPPLAYAALKALVKHHVPGATDPEAVHWRNIGAPLYIY